MEALVEASAMECGLTVSDQELQLAADQFRMRRGLSSAEKTQQWLSREKLSLEQFERRIELDTLKEKFQDDLYSRLGEEFFRVNAERYSRVRLRRLVVASQNQARELMLQIQDEGASFVSLAARHSLDVQDRRSSGDLGVLLRRQLRPDVADAVFSGKPGDVAGPVHGPLGFELYLVEDILPPDLNPATCAAIREELFRRFVASQLAEVSFADPCTGQMLDTGVNDAATGTP